MRKVVIKLKYRLCLLFLGSIFFISGCSTAVEHYQPIYDSLEKEQYKETVKLLEQARQADKYQYKDRVLYSIEKGLALHYAGLHKQSNERLSLADQYITELYTRRISKIGFSFLINDNELPYPGEPYEDIYINVFKALNYAELGDRQAVFVETRKLDNKLSYMENRYRDLAENYNSGAEEELEKDLDMKSIQKNENFKPRETRFHSSALGHYLGFITRLQLEEKDDARIDLEKLKKSFSEQPDIYNFDLPDLPSIREVPAGKTRVHFLASLGKGPKKYQVNDRLRYKDLYVTIAYPKLKKRGTSISKVEITREGKTVTTLKKLEDVNKIAQNVFKLHQPLIQMKSFIRGIGKAIVSKKARSQTDNFLLQLLILGLQEATEQADLRTTRLLPGEFHVGYLTVPAHEEISLTAHFYSNNKLIKEKSISKTFQPGNINLVCLKSFK